MKKMLFILALLLMFSGSATSQCVNVYNCWIKHFNGTADNTDRLNDIEVSSISGNAFATGESRSAFGAHSDFVTIKYSPEGDTLWTRVYNGTGDGQDIAYSVAIDNLENVYVTGESKGTGSTGPDYVTIKYNSSGVLQWVNRYDGASSNADIALSVCVDASQNIIVSGYSHGGAGTGYNFYTIKYNPAGYEIWRRGNDFGSGDFADQVTTDKYGNVYIIGYSVSNSNTAHDFRTVKYDSAGTLKWHRMYDQDQGHDEPYDICIDKSGNVYVTGKGSDFGEVKFLTVKYDSLGTLKWNKTYVNIGAGNIARAVIADTLGGVYVTGESGGFLSNDDFATIKYNADNGNQIWVSRYNGLGNGADKPTTMVQGKNGKIFVGGGSFGSGTNNDFVVVEYDMATGDSCFVSRFLETSNENITAMAINYEQGYLYACGTTSAGAGFTDGMTSRYCLLGVVNSVFNVKAVIEGFYDSGFDILNMSDTVQTYLRTPASPYLLVDSSKAILNSGTLTFESIFNNVPTGIYLITLNHRNSIGVWSKSGGESLICGITNYIDLTTASSKVYGNNQIQVAISPVRFAIYSGDVNQDGIVDITDVSLIYNDAAIFNSGYVPTDVTGDGFTDLTDGVFAENNAKDFVSVIIP
ncbi:MAG: SBBP repeat-containing protein [Ignavibacteria bacterium]|nr:SBBP repeat-containing protein [Ignavibacteria bacterium]